MKNKRIVKRITKVLFIFVIIFFIFFITNPYFIPKTIQKIKLANEVSFEYVLLLDKLDRLNTKYSKNPSESIKEKIQEIENKIQLKYSEQIGPS